jgi:glycosyltransferase involved in cell wall biosynthesis
MGHKQGLENVLECARTANGSCRRLLFLLMGDGNQRSHLEDLAKRHAIPNLRFLPIQPPDVFQSTLAAADILLVNQRGAVSDMSLPSKLTSYFAAGRPIIAAVQQASETAREIEASGGGLVVPPDEPGVLLEAVRRLSNEEGWRLQMGESARAWSMAKLSKAAALDGYEQLLAAALAHGKRLSTPARIPEEAEA